MSKSPLGRGLSSLIPNKSTEHTVSSVNQASSGQNNLGQGLTYIENIDIQSISLNPYQPRVEFDEQEIFNLAQSIKDKGLLQPLTVSRIDQNRYELIAGERRLRAIKSLGITTVPVIIRENVSDKDKAELALIENIQRQNLNPIEKAKGFADLHQKFEMTQENIATHLGISRSVVANTLRYLQLPKTVQNALREGHITEGHAKIIAGLPTQALQEKVLQNIISNALNVRQTEQVVKKDPNQQLNQVSPEVKQWIQGLSEKIHNKVEVRKKGKRYIVTMNFFSEEEIKSIYQKLL